MRGTFVLVVAAGAAFAAGWAWVRQAADDAGPDSAGLDGRMVSADPPPPESGDQDGAREKPTVAPEPVRDAPAAARALLAGDARALRDETVRRRAIQVGETLLRDADSADTATGTESRALARRVFAAVYDCDASSADERVVCYERSRALFDTLIRGNGAPSDLVLRHRIESGQNLWSLARGPWRQAGVSVAPGFVLWVNGVSDARRIRAGQTLKVPLEPLSILVRKKSFELTVRLGGAPVERVSVAVGSDAKTPVGTFRATDCLKNPDWYMNGKRIPYGSPGHIIGTRWIGLGGGPQAEGIGLHGTTDEASIGTAASQGCVRLKNADIERIFEWVSTGTTVEIRD